MSGFLEKSRLSTGINFQQALSISQIKTVKIIHSNARIASGITSTKVKLSLCLTTHHTTKTYGWVEVYLHTLLTLARDRGGCFFA
jgi:hypothetical protein